MRALPLLAMLSLALHASPAWGQTIVLLKTASAKGSVGPYEEAAKGFKDAMAPAREVVIFPDIPVEYAAESVRLEKPDLLVALGGEAARFAAEQFPTLPRVVALAPGVTGVTETPLALLTSEVPASVQMRWIGEVLPDVSAIGIVYDPRASQRTVDDLSAAANSASNGRARPLSIVPIAVGAENEIPGAFKRARGGIQALLFVPDSTVITKGSINYLLKESLAAQIPAIGFNWYFVDNGAVLAFGIDYPALGRQTAKMARQLARTGESGVDAPAKVTVWVNSRVAQKLRIRTDYDPDEVTEIR